MIGKLTYSLNNITAIVEAEAGAAAESPNIVYVRTNPAVGEFSSVTAALASITDNSQANLYIIKVDPGIFYFSSTIVMKPYVIIQGTEGLSVLVYYTGGADGGHNLIQGCWNTSLRNINITSAYGRAGIGSSLYYDGTSGDPNNTRDATAAEAFSLVDVRFGATGKLATVNGATKNALLFMVNCSWGGTAPFKYGFEVIGGTLARLNIRSSVTVAAVMAATLPEYMIKCHGPESYVLVSSTNFRTGGIGGKGLWVYNGGTAYIIGSFIDGWAQGIYTDLVGAAPTVHAVGTSLLDNTMDILLEHTGTSGSFSGTASHAKVSSVAPTFGWSYVDVDDTELEITGALSVQFPLGTHTNIIPLITHQALGLMSGGLLADAGGLTVSVTDLDGYYYNSLREVAQAILTNIPDVTLVDDEESYVYVNNLGAVVSSVVYPEASTTILLGRVVTRAGGIVFIDHTSVVLSPAAQNYGEIAKVIFGARYVSGSVVTVGTTGLQLDITDGRYYFGSEEFLPGGGQDIAFVEYSRDGSGGWNTGSATSLDSGYYDNNGTLTAIPAGKFVKHSMYVLADVPDAYYVVYGQETFASALLAEAGNLPTPPSYFRDGVVIIASFIIEQGASTITSIISERPFSAATTSGGLASANDHTGLSNLTVSDAGHTQFLMLNGSKAMTGALDMGSFGITNVGNVDGVDVSTHASRHLPLGADGLATAAPSVNLSSTSTNAVGIANSFARSDHSHAVDIVTQVITNGVTTTAPSEDAVYDGLATTLSSAASDATAKVSAHAGAADPHTEYLKATGTRAGATSQAQSFGANGIVADVVEESTSKAGVKVRGTKYYGVLTADPTVGAGFAAPEEGDSYWNSVLHMEMRYDASRLKWLSEASLTIHFGATGNVTAGTAYEMATGIIFSATNGVVAHYNGTIVAMSLIRTDTDSATTEVLASGVATGAELTHAAVKAKTIVLNSNFNADSVLAIRNKAGGNTTSGLTGRVVIKWRA